MHYKDKFSAYINHELPREERQEIAEHLLQCEDCRAEHDQVKLGAGLAAMLQQKDAPADTWSGIEAAMSREEKAAAVPFFNTRAWALGAAFSLAVLIGVGAIAYFVVMRSGEQPLADNQPPVSTPVPVSTVQPEITPAPTTDALIPETPETTPSAPETAPEIAQNKPASDPVITPRVGKDPKSTRPAAAIKTWNFETLAGAPILGASSGNGKLAVGDYLETDANSRARIEVADIGNVEIEPNSRVKLVNTSKNEHRLALDRGTLQAQIIAPPRLFIVDTPSAVAVDLGCAYKLDVDDEGNAKLYVTSGYVSLERDGRESIVPAGAIAFTRHGKGVGTPFFASATPELGAALERFDFDKGGKASLATIISESRAEDTLTLWHLLPRVDKPDREKLYDVLAAFVAPPDGVTREGVMKLDKDMLEAWRIEMERFWYA